MNTTTQQHCNGLSHHIRMPRPVPLAENPREHDMDHDALLLTEALRAAHNAPDVRASRVAALRAEVEAGTYAINDLDIATALITENPMLFQV